MGLYGNGEERITRIEKEVGGRNKEEEGRGGGQSVGAHQVFVLMLHSFHKKNMRAFLPSLCSEASNTEMWSLSQLLNLIKMSDSGIFLDEKAVLLCLLYAYLSISCYILNYI